MSKQITVRQMADQAAKAMIAMGQKPSGVWSSFYPACVKIVHFYEKKGLEYYDPKVTSEYTATLEKRFDNNEISRYTYNYYIKDGGAHGRTLFDRKDSVFLQIGTQTQAAEPIPQCPARRIFGTIFTPTPARMSVGRYTGICTG